jgi:hypothetical protein
MFRRVALLCSSCVLFGGLLGCYGTLAGTVSHRQSPGGGVSAAVDGMLLASEVGYAQHSGGEQPKIHSLRAAMAVGYPMTEPRANGLTIVPRIYYGVDRSWSALGADTTFPVGGEVSMPYLFDGDWGFVIAPRYFRHFGSDWEPQRSNEFALSIGITECLDRKAEAPLPRFCL